LGYDRVDGAGDKNGYTGYANLRPLLDQFADAAAHTVLTFAQTTSAGNGKWKNGMEYQGSSLRK
jgi:hypothetical protein